MTTRTTTGHADPETAVTEHASAVAANQDDSISFELVGIEMTKIETAPPDGEGDV